MIVVLKPHATEEMVQRMARRCDAAEQALQRPSVLAAVRDA